MKSHKWLVPLRVREQAQSTLVCFPYAGGNAHLFRSWVARLAPEMDLWAVEFPGRGQRFSEPLDSHLPSVVQMLCHELVELVMGSRARPVSLFGHSMGALVAFEAARSLKQACGVELARLFVSGRGAACAPLRHEPMHALPEPEFIEKLVAYGGLPREVLDSEALLKLFLPILRTDFALCELYQFRPEPLLKCPLDVLLGTDDSTVHPADAARWAELSVGATSTHVFAGDHFFLRSAERDVTAFIASRCARPLAASCSL